MSTAQITPRTRKAPNPSLDTAGSTAAGPRHRGGLGKAVRNIGIVLDTAARVVFLGRDGVKY